MAKFYGKSNEELYRTQLLTFKDNFENLVWDEMNNMKLITGDEAFDKVVLGASVVFSGLRGFLNFGVNTLEGFALGMYGVVNTIQHMKDKEDGTTALKDLEIASKDMMANFATGLASFGIGAAADVSKMVGGLFGKDVSTEWAYGEEGLINNFDEMMTAFQANARLGIDTSKMTTEEMLSQRTQEENQAIIDTTWDMDYSKQIVGAMNGVVSSSDWVKENIVNKITAKNFFDEATMNNETMQKINGAVESIGQIVPSILISRFGGKLGLNEKQTAAVASAYFSANVFGQSMDEAMKSGVSMEDAFTYAMSNAMSEVLIEGIGGYSPFKPSTAFTKSTLNAFISEGTEEMFSEIGSRGQGMIIGDVEEESAKDIWARVWFAGAVGGVGGGLLGGINLANFNKSVGGKATNLDTAIATDIGKLGVEQGTKNIQKRLNKLEEAFSNTKISQEEKVKAYESSVMAQELFKLKEDGTFELTAKALKVQKGEMLSTQNGVEINKETHAIGRQDYLTEYESEGIGEGNSDIYTMQELEQAKSNGEITQGAYDTINFAREHNLPIAFVKNAGGKGYYVGDYIYVDPKLNTVVTNVVNHEMYHQLSEMYDRGLMNDKQAKAFEKLREFASTEAFSDLVNFSIPLSERFDTLRSQYEEFYGQHLQGEALKNKMLEEEMAWNLGYVFSNTDLLSEIVRKSPTLKDFFDATFKNQSQYNKLLKEMGIESKDLTESGQAMFKEMANLKKAYAEALRKNKEHLQKSKVLANDFRFGKSFMFGSSDDDEISLADLLIELESLKETVDARKEGRLTKNELIGLVRSETMKQIIEQSIKDGGTKYQKNNGVEIITEENYPELNSRNYFAKIGNYVYKADAFDSLFANKDSYDIRSIDFDNGSFVIDFKTTLEEKKYRGLTIYVHPSLLLENGEVIENPVLLLSGIGSHNLDTILSGGTIPGKSFGVENAGGFKFQTEQFTETISDEFNSFKVFVGLKQESMTEPRTMVSPTDFWSHSFRVDSNDSTIGYMDVIRREFNEETGEYEYKRRPETFHGIDKAGSINKKGVTYGLAGIWWNNMNNINKGYTTRIGTDYKQVDAESLMTTLETLRNANREDLKQGRTSVAKLRNKLKTQTDFRNVDLFELLDESISSFQYLIDNDFNIEDIGYGLRYYDGVGNISDYELREKVEEGDNYVHFRTILKYLDFHQYETNNVSEGLIDMNGTKINSFIIKNTGSMDLQNEGKLKELIDYAEANGINIEYEYSKENYVQTIVKNNNKFKSAMLNKDANKKSKATNKKAVKEQIASEKVVDENVNYLDDVAQKEVQESQTNETKTTLKNKPLKTKKKTIPRYKVVSQQGRAVDVKTYKQIEDDYADNIVNYLEKSKKLKGGLNKTINVLNESWGNYIHGIRTSNRVYNHMSAVASKTIMNELIELQNKIKNDKTRTIKKPTNSELELVLKKVNEAIFSGLKYVDENITVDINKTETNPNGFLYTKAIHWYFRDMLEMESWTKEDIENFDKDMRGVAYRRLVNAILNFNDEKGQQELKNAMTEFHHATEVETITDLALDSNAPRTIKNSMKQWLNNTEKINNVKRVIDYKTGINQLYDPFTTSEILGLYDNNSWSMVLMEKILRGVDRQIKIRRVFDAIFEQDNWLVKNDKNIKNLEKETVELSNLRNATLTKSQVMYLRNMMLREIARNRAIDMGIIKGKKTHHFKDGFDINILAISEFSNEKMDNKQVGRIVSAKELLKELDNIIEEDAFIKDYNEKVLEMFSEMYPYVNERYKEINGLSLRNDGHEINDALKSIDKSKRDAYLNSLPPSVDINTINNLYVPFLMHNSSYFSNDKVDFKQIYDLGVFEGMTQELSDSNGIVSVESISNVISNYEKEVGNYYGLHRVMRDLNIVLNEKIPGYEQTRYVNANIDKGAVEFYENLLLDIAGYKPNSRNPRIKKAMSVIRRNFYKASLGANVKVIFTQFATMLNLSNIYGDMSPAFYQNFVKNMYGQLKQEEKAKVDKMLEDNNIFWDRTQMTTFEIGEATKQGIGGHNKFNEMTEFLMKGISITDNAINKAFYLTLLETTNPETGELFTEEEASETLKVAILRSQSSALAVSKAALLRTDNEVVKIFLKFMGEPMKLVTQIASSKKQLELIQKLEISKESVIREFKEVVEDEKKALANSNTKLVELESFVEEGDFSSLSETEQREVLVEIYNLERLIAEQEERVVVAQQNVKDIEKQIDDTIASKEKAERLARNRIASLFTTMSYLSTLQILFSLVRGDYDDDEEKTFTFFIERFGIGMFEELISMLPGVRDVYQLIGKGYDLDNFDEIGSINNLGKSMYYLIQAAITGKEIDWGKNAYLTLTNLGKMFGIPTKNMERIFKTLTRYASETALYKYNTMIGAKNTDNQLLAKAVANNNTQMISTIIEKKLDDRNISVSSRVERELVRLASEGFEVSITGINDSFTIDGVEYTMNSSQKTKFASVYNKADAVIQKILQSSAYKRLDDDYKQTVIQAIYNYYYKMAKQEFSGVEQIPKSNYYTTLAKAYNYFVGRAESYYKQQKSA